MPLSDAKIRSLKPSDKPYKVSDEKALSILVTPSGSKLWRMKYRFGNKEKTLSVGSYPDISLSHARSERDAARTLLARGIDPMEEKRANLCARQEAHKNSFESVAREWMIKRGKKSESGDKRLIRLLEKDLFPYLGK